MYHACVYLLIVFIMVRCNMFVGVNDVVIGTGTVGSDVNVPGIVAYVFGDVVLRLMMMLMLMLWLLCLRCVIGLCRGLCR